MLPFRLSQPIKLLYYSFLRQWRRVADASNVGCSADKIVMTTVKPQTLPGKWPDSVELLSRRLAHLNLDENSLRQRAPQVLRDMQRACTQCASKERCEHDFEYRPLAPTWRAYCPNSQKLAVLDAEQVDSSGRTTA
jgi:hypothetical protein